MYVNTVIVLFEVDVCLSYSYINGTYSGYLTEFWLKIKPNGTSGCARDFVMECEQNIPVTKIK